MPTPTAPVNRQPGLEWDFTSRGFAKAAIALSLFAYERLAAIETQSADLQRDYVPSLYLAGRVRDVSIQIDAGVQQHVLEHDAEKMQQLASAIQQKTIERLDLLARHDTLLSNPEERALAEATRTALAPYVVAETEVLRSSADPRTKPALRFNYLSTAQDRREWVEAIRVARSILDQPAFDPYNGGETSPGPEVASDEEVLDWVARDAETALHPSCTCAMGSVVDPATMRVYGLDGLRVVDASVFPFVPNGNIYAPTMMVAEKAADLIRGNTPLPPEEVPFHVAERAHSR